MTIIELNNCPLFLSRSRFDFPSNFSHLTHQIECPHSTKALSHTHTHKPTYHNNRGSDLGTELRRFLPFVCFNMYVHLKELGFYSIFTFCHLSQEKSLRVAFRVDLFLFCLLSAVAIYLFKNGCCCYFLFVCVYTDGDLLNRLQ